MLQNVIQQRDADMKNAGGFVAPAGEGVFTEWYDDETASKVQQR